MRAILHLGTEKTGTSMIQRFLKKNRDALVEQGFYFMKSTGEADDRKLSAYCLLEGQFDDFHRGNLIDTEEKKKEFEKKLEEDVEREIRGLPGSVHTIIFSSEHLHSRVKLEEQREKLKSLLCRHFDSIELLSYIRPQIEVAISHYSTYLKTQGYAPLSEYLKRCKAGNYYYDNWRYLSGWEESFPANSLKVRIFDRKELVGGDVVVDFCQAVSLDDSRLENIETANESVLPTGQELLKVINKNFDVFIKGVVENPARVALVQIISRLFPGSGQKPTADQAREIQSQFSEINEKVRLRWFPERDSLFDIRYEKFDQQEAIDWGVVQFFERFIEEYSELSNAQLSGIPPRFVDDLRDISLMLEGKDLSSAFALMQLASLLRPKGPHINKKVAEYRDILQRGNKIGKRELSNEERVELYFSVNHPELIPKKVLNEPSSAYKSDEPICINFSKKELAVSKKLRLNYLSDFKYFVELNDAREESFFVQFGDASPKVHKDKLIFCKARDVRLGRGNSVILKLNKPRHWDVKEEFDQIGWFQKRNSLVWRGNFTGVKDIKKNKRVLFVKRYSERFDVGAPKIGQIEDDRVSGLVVPFLSIKQQLECKYIVSLEGNDVATNLKWILASNSIPIMPSPKKESWLLESRLVPYVHYVPLNDELDNLDEVYEWCLSNDEHCKQIAENGKRYMEMFFDEENEKEIYRMIYSKYKELMAGGYEFEGMETLK